MLDNLTPRQQDEIEALLDAEATRREIKDYYQIKWRGKIIKTISGKSSFNSVRAAKLAFSNHLRRVFAYPEKFAQVINPNQPMDYKIQYQLRDEIVGKYRNDPKLEIILVKS